jgi:hypothetical protein
MCRPRFLALGLTRRPLPVIEQSNGVELKMPRGASYLYFKIKMFAPARASKFEREVRRRKLNLDDQKSLLESAPLRTWAEKHRFPRLHSQRAPGGVALAGSRSTGPRHSPGLSAAALLVFPCLNYAFPIKAADAPK